MTTGSLSVLQVYVSEIDIESLWDSLRLFLALQLLLRMHIQMVQDGVKVPFLQDALQKHKTEGSSRGRQP